MTTHQATGGPTSLLTQLKAAGQTPTGRGLKPGRCRTCRTQILVGLNSDGLHTEVDPYPLTAHGEALALLAGISTHEVTISPTGALRLSTRRQRRRIQYRPANAHRGLWLIAYDVVRQHACNTPTPPPGLAPTSQLIRPPQPSADAQPPY